MLICFCLPVLVTVGARKIRPFGPSSKVGIGTFKFGEAVRWAETEDWAAGAPRRRTEGCRREETSRRITGFEEDKCSTEGYESFKLLKNTFNADFRATFVLFLANSLGASNVWFYLTAK